MAFILLQLAAIIQFSFFVVFPVSLVLWRFFHSINFRVDLFPPPFVYGGGQHRGDRHVGQIETVLYRGVEDLLGRGYFH